MFPQVKGVEVEKGGEGKASSQGVSGARCSPRGVRRAESSVCSELGRGLEGLTNGES